MDEVLGDADFLDGAVTVIENAVNDAVAIPSLTEITMPANAPVVPVGGVPESRPVLVLSLWKRRSRKRSRS